MGVLKKDKATVEPQFENEDGAAAVVEKTKPVTRADVADKAPKAAAEPAGEVVGEATEVKEAGQAIEVKTGDAPAGEDLGEKQLPAEEGNSQPVAKAGSVLARTDTGKLKTFLSAGSSSKPDPLRELRNAFAAQNMKIDYSTFPRLRVDAGKIATSEGKEAGDWIELQVISYNAQWTIAPGVEGDAGKEFVRFSSDNEKLDSNGGDDEFADYTPEQYAEYLRTDKGFEKAAVKEYTIVYGIAVAAQELDFEFMNEVVALQLAPQSVGLFDRYMISRRIKVMMGRLQETSGNPVVKWESERVKGKKQTYFNLKPSDGTTEPLSID